MYPDTYYYIIINGLVVMRDWNSGKCTKLVCVPVYSLEHHALSHCPLLCYETGIVYQYIVGMLFYYTKFC